MLFSANKGRFESVLRHALCFLFFAVSLPKDLFPAEKTLSSTVVVADDAAREGGGQERRRDSNATDSNSTSWQWATDRGAGSFMRISDGFTGPGMTRIPFGCIFPAVA